MIRNCLAKLEKLVERLVQEHPCDACRTPVHFMLVAGDFDSERRYQEWKREHERQCTAAGRSTSGSPASTDARPRPDRCDGGGMSGLANRLSKLERVAAATWVDCAGCIAAESKTRFLVVLPRPPAPPELSEQVHVRCEVCGQERTGSTIVMSVIGPSIRKSFGEGAAACSAIG